ncbi:MAG TPA: hypothetical protein VG735_07170 [Caulobacterales bacterium]|nr:hypothetical protein [Caulobacterales bacterium]
MSTALVLGGVAAGGLLLAALIVFIVRRGYIARTDRTFMTHDERGFKRALSGKGVLWDFEESVVKGPDAPRLEYVAADPTTGLRRAGKLIDPRTGSINLRPQYCVPLPFAATTADGHRMMVEARVQFSLNRDLLKYVYQLDDFGLALETRIQSAFRAEIGKRQDEVLRASLHEVEAAAIEVLRKGERDGDEAGEPGMALGVNFHSASFTYADADTYDAAPAMSVAAATGAPGSVEAGAPQGVRAITRGLGVLSLRPQQLDLIADVFKGRDPASTQAMLAILEMQTRQNIAEALAGSGQLVVVTAQELGLAGALAQRDAMEKSAAAAPPLTNGAGAARHV